MTKLGAFQRYFLGVESAPACICGMLIASQAWFIFEKCVFFQKGKSFLSDVDLKNLFFFYWRLTMQIVTSFACVFFACPWIFFLIKLYICDTLYVTSFFLHTKKFKYLSVLSVLSDLI